jgi:hypothetical protein
MIGKRGRVGMLICNWAQADLLQTEREKGGVRMAEKREKGKEITRREFIKYGLAAGTAVGVPRSRPG